MLDLNGIELTAREKGQIRQKQEPSQIRIWVDMFESEESFTMLSGLVTMNDDYDVMRAPL